MSSVPLTWAVQSVAGLELLALAPQNVCVRPCAAAAAAASTRLAGRFQVVGVAASIGDRPSPSDSPRTAIPSSAFGAITGNPDSVEYITYHVSLAAACMHRLPRPPLLAVSLEMRCLWLCCRRDLGCAKERKSNWRNLRGCTESSRDSRRKRIKRNEAVARITALHNLSATKRALMMISICTTMSWTLNY